MKRFESVLRAGAAVVALSAGSGAAWAQSTLPPPNIQQQPASAAPATPQGEIVITGSRIRRNPLDLDAPRVFIDQSDIQKTGLSSINDVLQRLPSSGGGANSRFNNSGNLGNPPDGGGVGAGSAEIDLRYLGSRRTLVLVDGLRFVNAASASGVPGSVDLNSIPESMIERVEVLQDGASTIYGSDAIAGVVNIITKSSQRGLALSAQVGSYLDHNDGWTQNYQASWGNGDGPTQIVIGGNYVQADGVLSGNRALSAFPNPYSTSCLDGGCSSFPLNTRFGGPVFGPSLLTLAHPVTGRPVFPTDFRPFTTADRFNFAPFNYLEIPLKRYGGFANFKQEIGSDTHFQLKGLWNRRVSINQAAPIPLGIGPDVGNGNLLDHVTVSGTNPFNPFGFDLIPNDGSPGGNFNEIKRRVIEAGPRHFEQKVTTYYGTATLDGRLGDDWFWDLNGVYGKNKAKQTMLGNINAQRVQQALGPIANCTAPCVPLDLFGTPGAITPAMLAFIGFTQHDSSEQSIWDFTGNISGKWFDVGGGPLGIAGGVEYRRLKGRFDPDPVVAAGFSSDIPAQPARGGYKVAEVYGEFEAPFIKGRPGAELLELDGSARYSHYKVDATPAAPSHSFSHTTFKVNGNWKPVEAVRVRASYAEGFRAPQIGELTGGLSRFDSAIDDPCSINSVQPRRFNNDATVHANCLAQGVPASGAQTAPTDQLGVVTGGNPNLTPETSKSTIVGVVANPIRGFSAEMNWYDIRVKGAIQSIPAATTLFRCVLTNDPLACSNVSRSVGTGNVTQIRGILQNIAGIRTSGIDVNLAYRRPLPGMGEIGFTWNNTFLQKFDVTTPTAAGTTIEHRAGQELGSPSQGYPRWKSIGIVDWNGFGWGVTLTGRYISRIKEILNNESPLKATFYTDAQVRWAPRLGLLDGVELAVGVNNAFNVRTPGCFSCDVNNMDPTLYDTPGRFYYARLSVKAFGGRRAVPPPYTPMPAPPPPPAVEPAPPPPPAAVPPPPPPPAAKPERG